MVNQSVTRTLYRELLSSARRIEALTRQTNTARISARLQSFGDPYAEPTERVRRAFRMNRTSPTAADDAFAALFLHDDTVTQEAEIVKIAGWLQRKLRLVDVSAVP